MSDPAARPRYTIEEVREAIRACGPFYHATTAEAYEQIKVAGLLPERADGMVTAAALRPALCYTPASFKGKWFRKMQTRNHGASVVLLEIRGDVLAELDVAIDSTSNEWWWQERLHGITTATGLLQAGVDITCSDVIAREDVVLVAQLPARPERECLGAENDPWW